METVPVYIATRYDEEFLTCAQTAQKLREVPREYIYASRNSSVRQESLRIQTPSNRVYFFRTKIIVQYYKVLYDSMSASLPYHKIS